MNILIQPTGRCGARLTSTYCSTCPWRLGFQQCLRTHHAGQTWAQIIRDICEQAWFHTIPRRRALLDTMRERTSFLTRAERLAFMRQHEQLRDDIRRVVRARVGERAPPEA